jgi:hypothetical protein
MELYEHAREVIAPTSPSTPRSHPSARERHLNLLNNVQTRHVKSIRTASESIVAAVESFKPAVADYLSLQIESFETYGSYYLGPPNTEWRGRELIDRKDYY